MKPRTRNSSQASHAESKDSTVQGPGAACKAVQQLEVAVRSRSPEPCPNSWVEDGGFFFMQTLVACLGSSCWLVSTQSVSLCLSSVHLDYLCFISLLVWLDESCKLFLMLCCLSITVRISTSFQNHPLPSSASPEGGERACSTLTG